MLGLEERGQQRIDAQQSGARQPHAIAFDGEQSLVGILPPRIAPMRQHVDAELFAEVTGIDLARFNCRISSRTSNWCGLARSPRERRQLARFERP